LDAMADVFKFMKLRPGFDRVVVVGSECVRE
jgi:hypothetical protein